MPQARRNSEKINEKSQKESIANSKGIQVDRVVKKNRNIKLEIKKIGLPESITHTKYFVEYYKEIVLNKKKIEDVFIFTFLPFKKGEEFIKSDYDILDEDKNVVEHIEAKQDGNLLSETLSINKNIENVTKFFKLASELGLSKEQAEELHIKALKSFIEYKGQEYLNIIKEALTDLVLSGRKIYKKEDFDLGVEYDNGRQNGLRGRCRTTLNLKKDAKEVTNE